MKIISKKTEKDYYDNGAVYGVDETKLYVRKQEEIIINHKDFDLDNYIFHQRWAREDHTHQLLGFCGQIYFLNNYSLREYRDYWYRHPKDHILFDDENLQFKFKELEKQPHNISYVKYEKLKKEKTQRMSWRDIDEEAYSKYKNNKKLQQIFIDYKTPVFLITPTISNLTLVINPLLKDFGFYRFKDTIQTFQEIEMFLGSVLVNNDTPEMPVGDDITIASSKGFNKYSFRKDPTKRKNKNVKKT